MKLKYANKSEFLSRESVTEEKVMLNICDKYDYGVTDANQFYGLYYTKPEQDFKNTPTSDKDYGNIFFTEIFSYHKICNMICVQWPKTQYNIRPFKIDHFRKCLLKLKEYMTKNNIKLVYTPVFAKDIFQGDWGGILTTMNSVFDIDTTVVIFK